MRIAFGLLQIIDPLVNQQRVQALRPGRLDHGRPGQRGIRHPSLRQQGQLVDVRHWPIALEP